MDSIMRFSRIPRSDSGISSSIIADTVSVAMGSSLSSGRWVEYSGSIKISHTVRIRSVTGHRINSGMNNKLLGVWIAVTSSEITRHLGGGDDSREEKKKQ